MKLEQATKKVWNHLTFLRHLYPLGKVGGVEVDKVIPLVRFILTSCPNIHFVGLMTIEEPDNFTCFDVCLPSSSPTYQSAFLSRSETCRAKTRC